MKTLLALAAVGAFALSVPASAAELRAGLQEGLRRASSPDPASAISKPSTGVGLTASSRETSVVLALSINQQETGDRMGARDITVRLSTPLDKNTNEGNFLTGGAPTTGTSLEVV